MCALAQQLIDPYFRTIEGFTVLIEKDWISFGHQFHLRFGQYDRNYDEKQRSPVFIQYLDCLRQLLIQFPYHFEFNHELLLFIAEEVYTHKYGTFLGNCELDRKEMRVRDNTESMWTYVMLEKARFTNRFYNPVATKDIIEQIPLTAPFCLQEWREFHFKWSKQSHCVVYQDLTTTECIQNSHQAVQLENTRIEKQQLQDLLK